ncbi:hypothetical protein SAMN04488066_106129 [Halorubrum aquaticum]|uniref:Uncharacterized protein n=1 Tax=Halorubrum aquaticum TaxID=387340 RepID=A0A1I3AP28_9EURY|nr:hypothetical protein SAMN04488066_106129 [Halorubrum aquaticum]
MMASRWVLFVWPIAEFAFFTDQLFQSIMCLKNRVSTEQAEP